MAESAVIQGEDNGKAPHSCKMLVLINNPTPMSINLTVTEPFEKRLCKYFLNICDRCYGLNILVKIVTAFLQVRIFWNLSM